MTFVLLLCALLENKLNDQNQTFNLAQITMHTQFVTTSPVTFSATIEGGLPGFARCVPDVCTFGDSFPGGMDTGLNGLGFVDDLSLKLTLKDSVHCNPNQIKPHQNKQVFITLCTT